MSLNITKVEISPETELKNVLGVATITLSDSFVVSEIRIVKGKKGVFLGMPSGRVGPDQYADTIFPITQKAREQITNAIMEKFRKDFPDLAKDKDFEVYAREDYKRFK